MTRVNMKDIYQNDEDADTGDECVHWTHSWSGRKEYQLFWCSHPTKTLRIVKFFVDVIWKHFIKCGIEF
jgi:hypothetical protein